MNETLSTTLINSALVVVFILIGAFFAASEIALVSLRESRVKTLAERSRRGVKVASLYNDPNRFLAAVQLGVTVAGFLSAAFGASTLASSLTPVLQNWGLPEAVADALALVSITLVIAYFSIVFGELAPKRLAMQRPEGFALFSAPLLDGMATVVRPVTWLLSVSSNMVVRALGGDPDTARDVLSAEELRDLVARHETLGGVERKMIDEIFQAAERRLYEVMLPRTEVDFLDADLPVSQAVALVATQPHSRYPVVSGSHDDVVGFVHVRDLFAVPSAQGDSGSVVGADGANGPPLNVGQIARQVVMLPSTMQIVPALSHMRRVGQHLAIVLDEYGGTDGIVTLEDLVEELVGDIRDEYDQVQGKTRSLRGGVFEVDGLLSLSDFTEQTSLHLPEGPYETVAGFLMSQLGRVPVPGDQLEVEQGYVMTVMQLTGRRVERVRLAPEVVQHAPLETGQHPGPREGGPQAPSAQSSSGS